MAVAGGDRVAGGEEGGERGESYKSTQQRRKPKRKDTRVPQPSDPIENVVDEAVHKELGNSLVRAATTASRLEAEQDSGGGPWCQETMWDNKRKAQSGKRSSKELSDKRRKPLEFLRVGDWSTIECVALEGRSAFLKEGVHDTFYVSNLKKCLADANLHVPLNEIKIDKTLRFVEELVEIMDHEIRNLKRSRYHL
ncbi:hypothetical protein Tco_1010114 [Tanacetum coccineum]